MNKIKIGLFGFGCVGQGFYKILEKNPTLPYVVDKICVKSKAKKRPELDVKWVFNPDELLKDEGIDIIVEAIDDAEIALEIAKTSLSRGKIVISANKKMIAENLELLVELEQKTAGSLYCEGAVAGSIPVLQTIAHYYQFDKVNAFKGILNGSSNYILTRIAEDNLTYAKALEQAQQKGFAETDPSLDVEGYDARYKLSILVYLLFGVTVDIEQIPRIGINQIAAEDFHFARKNNLNIKLVAHAAVSEKGWEAWVAPTFVPVSSALGQVNNEFNAIQLNGAFAGNQILMGKGAGEFPTGLALIGDLNRSTSNRGDFNSVSAPEANIGFHDRQVDVYYSYNPHQLVNWDAFDHIYEKASKSNRSYALGSIRLSLISELITEDASLIFLSGTSCEFATRGLQYSNVKTGTFSA